MNPQQYRKLKELFMAAIRMDDADQAAYLDAQCAGDPELRRQIDALLRHHQPETVIDPGQPAPTAPALPAGVVSVDDVPEEAMPMGQLHERLVPGTQVGGRYRISGLLGRGGMGEVYRADDLTLGQTVALKFLSAGRASSPAWLSCFREEVRIARTVTHPNVCRVFDIGQAGGDIFLSMEYIDGEDLASLLRRIGRLPQDKALQVARQICAGLGAAHDQGVLHRDLKPANIMIDGLGQARITDFGIAAVAGPGEPTSLAGTPAYMAPELPAGEPASVRSDIYSLGLLLYEMVTGRQAFTADTFEERLAEAAPAPPGQFVEGLDPLFEATIMRCLEDDPDRRPPSAHAVAAALPGGDPLAAALAQGHTPSPDTVAGAWAEEVRPPAAAAWLCAALGGFLVVVLLAGRTFFLSNGGLDRNPAVLEDRALAAIAAIEHTEPAANGTYRFVIEPAARSSRRADAPPAGVSPGPAAGEARIVFEYRQGERHVLPAGPLAMPAASGMPWPAPDSRRLRLDPRGRLISYEALPEPASALEPSPRTPDWTVPFRLAGLREEAFTPVAPSRLPPLYADTVAAWESPASSADGGRVRVEAAAVGPHVTFFRVGSPDEADSTMPGIPAAIAMRYGLFLVLLAGAAALAWQNLRADRSDRRGARRLAVFLLCVQGVLWMARSRHHADFTLEAALVVNALRSMVFTGVVVWIFYIGLEPQVRRFWPRSIISWSRVLLGRFADPLVGRDLLVGLAAGIAIVLLRQVSVLLAHRLGLGSGWLVMPDAGADPGSMVGFRYAVEVTSQSLIHGTWMGLGLMLLMLLLRMALRNTWLAAGAFVVVGAVVFGFVLPSVQSLPWLTNGLILLVLTWVLTRVGLLATSASLFLTVLLTSLPLTFDVRAWYAGLTGLAAGLLGILLALGLYGALWPQSSRQGIPA